MDMSRKSSIHLFATELKINRLSMRKAFYRYIFAAYPISIIEFTLLFTQSGSLDENHENRIETISKFDFKNLKVERSQVFYQNCVQALRKANIAFRFVKRQDSGAKSAQKERIVDKSLNALLKFFDLNDDYQELIEKDQDLFTHEEISAIFKCSQEKVAFYSEMFRNSKQAILIHNSGASASINYLIYQLAAVKLSIINAQQEGTSSRELDNCNEGSIQLSLAFVRQYYIKKGQNQKLWKGHRRSFFQICEKDLSFVDLTFHTNQQIKRQLKNLILQKKQEVDQLGDVKRISEKFNMKQIYVERQFFQIKEDLLHQRPNKFQQVILLFNYHRRKHLYSNAGQIAKVIEQYIGPEAVRFIKDNFCQQMKKIAFFEEKNYINTTSYLIKLHMTTEQVLFIDHCQFYRQQFMLYNLISKNQSVTYDSKEFNPTQDTIFHLILGVTNNGAVFKHFTKKKLEIHTYIDEICPNFRLHKQGPSFIVIYIPILLQARQWQRINVLVAKFWKLKKTLILLPSKSIVPNAIKPIEYYLKRKTLVEMSHLIEQPDFEKRVEDNIDQKLMNISKFEVIQDIVKKVWRISK